AACSDPDGRGPPGDVPDQYRGRRAGDAGHVVVLGEPETPVAGPLGALCQFQRVGEGLAHVTALRDGSEVKERVRDHGRCPGSVPSSRWGRPPRLPAARGTERDAPTDLPRPSIS